MEQKAQYSLNVLKVMLNHQPIYQSTTIMVDDMLQLLTTVQYMSSKTVKLATENWTNIETQDLLQGILPKSVKRDSNVSSMNGWAIISVTVGRLLGSRCNMSMMSCRKLSLYWSAMGATLPRMIFRIRAGNVYNVHGGQHCKSRRQLSCLNMRHNKKIRSKKTADGTCLLCAGTNVKVGGGNGQMSGTKFCKKNLSCPSTFLALHVQLVVLVSAFVMGSKFWSVSCLPNSATMPSHS